jgi:hypothetical protein
MVIRSKFFGVNSGVSVEIRCLPLFDTSNPATLTPIDKFNHSFAVHAGKNYNMQSSEGVYVINPIVISPNLASVG